jgi:hypothetical protein
LVKRLTMQLSQFPLTSTMLKDRLPRMPVPSLVLTFSVL